MTLVGKVDIDLVEKTHDQGKDTEWDDTKHGKNMYPGQTVVKKPIVTVNANSSECLVYIKVTGVDEMVEKGFTIDGWDASEWNTLTVQEGKKDGIYRYKSAVSKSTEAQDLPAIFESVTYKTESVGSENPFAGQIDVKAAAIQSEGISEADANQEALRILNEAK